MSSKILCPGFFMPIFNKVSSVIGQHECIILSIILKSSNPLSFSTPYKHPSLRLYNQLYNSLGVLITLLLTELSIEKAPSSSSGSITLSDYILLNIGFSLIFMNGGASLESYSESIKFTKVYSGSVRYFTSSTDLAY